MLDGQVNPVGQLRNYAGYLLNFRAFAAGKFMDSVNGPVFFHVWTPRLNRSDYLHKRIEVKTSHNIAAVLLSYKIDFACHRE